MRTLGKGIVDIETPQGVAAGAATTATILASAHLGFGLSTTHVASGSILGSGVGKEPGSVRWSTAARMFIAWLLTLPVDIVNTNDCLLRTLAQVGGDGAVADGDRLLVAARHDAEPDADALTELDVADDMGARGDPAIAVGRQFGRDAVEFVDRHGWSPSVVAEIGWPA